MHTHRQIARGRVGGWETIILILRFLVFFDIEASKALRGLLGGWLVHGLVRAVLPNLCASAHKCAARAVEVFRGRMSEIKSFQWEVSLKFSTVIENVQFPKFSHGTLLPLHHNIII